MNAGLAAIFGALIGAASTTLATVFAYRAALITAREKETAATDQWRRNHRRDTYITMINAARDHFQVTEGWYDTHYRQPDQQGVPAPPQRIMEWGLQEQSHGGGTLRRAAIAVQLEGPPHLHGLAQALERKTRDYARVCLRHLSHEATLEDVKAALHAHNVALDEFTAAARDDIHEPKAVTGRSLPGQP